MTASLAFWTGSLLNLGVILALALWAVQAIRRGRWRQHRRLMLWAIALVGVFLVAYLTKVALLGHEDRSAWSPLDVTVLRVHEACIAAMLAGGAYAGFRALRFRRGLPDAPTLPPADPRSSERGGHRAAGRIAVAGAAGAWLTAAWMLAGMYARG